MGAIDSRFYSGGAAAAENETSPLLRLLAAEVGAAAAMAEEFIEFAAAVGQQPVSNVRFSEAGCATGVLFYDRFRPKR